MNESEFTHILRILNTNVDGRQKVMYALTSIKGVGRRFSNLVCKKADVDTRKRYVHGKSLCCSGPAEQWAGSSHTSIQRW